MQRQFGKPRILKGGADYWVALLWLMSELGEGRATQVIDEFERRLGHLILPKHRDLDRSGSLKWKKKVRWARQFLVRWRLMGSGGRGIWTITEAGRKWIRDHPDGGKDEFLALHFGRSDETVIIPWQDFRVVGGTIALSEVGQIEGSLNLEGGLTLSFTMKGSGASWHWQPDKPAFQPTRWEKEE